jgi:carbamoyltransferase
MHQSTKGYGAVLGLNLSHDRSACLIVDGCIRVAIAEERLSRIKHDIPLNSRLEQFCLIPLKAIDYCLNAAALSFDDIGLVVASTVYVLDSKTGQRRTLRIEDITRQCPGLAPERVRILGHHFSHAISSAWCSGFEDAAVIVIDGGGSIVKHSGNQPVEFERTTLYSMQQRELKMLRRSTGGPPDYGNSIGDFYQLINVFLGFRRGEEGKTMGLAAYGQPMRGSIFETAFMINDDCTHQVSPYFQFTATGGFAEKLTECFGPPRSKPRPDDTLDRHIAASAQWAIENALVKLCRAAKKIVKSPRLCLAGGVALNCVANTRILFDGPFDELFIQPASSDDGTALGNALWGWKLLTHEIPDVGSWSAYLGRPYDEHEISVALKKYEDDISVHRPENVAADVADSLERGLIVGMFRGGSEFGPRALGHRSIFCDSRVPRMQDHLNTRVKHREPFRPFAPLVLEAVAADYFELKTPSPFMLLAAAVRCPEKIPAVTHVDGSARIQTVNDKQDHFLCDLLRAFAVRTSVPVILNTSFNVAGEPIVETPADAIRCFLGTGIDVLYLEHFRIARKP